MESEEFRAARPAWGPWLEQQLRRHDLNQAEFAERVGVKPATVSRWVHGRVPEAKLLDRIADALGVDFDLVATRAGIRPPLVDPLPDGREALVLSAVRRIDWEADHPMLPGAVDMLQVLARTVPKQRVE